MRPGEHSVRVGPAPLDKLEAFASMTQLAVSLSNRLVAGPFSLVRRPADKRQPYIPSHRYD